MTFEKKRASTKQEIPTASMPDIIFMLLLFFMVTTTLREVEILVQYSLPEAEAIEKIENKRLISYIWVGTDSRLQINDSIVKLEDIQDIMYAKRQALPNVIVSLRIDKGIDIRSGGPELRFVTIEGVGFGTTVDSLLAIKKLIYEDKKYTISQLKDALDADFQGKDNEIIQTFLKNKVTKYGNDEEDADELARIVMKIWADETWKYETPTGFKYRPGMLSWNYWAGADAGYTVATPDGRNRGHFMSNAICPTNGADLKGPTAVTNAVGKALGGKTEDGEYLN